MILPWSYRFYIITSYGTKNVENFELVPSETFTSHFYPTRNIIWNMKYNMHSSQRPYFKTTLAFNVARRYDVALHKHWSEQTSKTSSEFFRALSSILDLWDWGEFLGLVGEVRSLDADDGLILCLMCGTFEFFCKQQQEVESLESRNEEVDDIAKSQSMYVTFGVN